MVTITHAPSCFGGNLILNREFVKDDNTSYIWLEGHEVGDRDSDRGNPKGHFRVAIWVPGGNDGDGSLDGDIHTAVRKMQEFVPPPGYTEKPIPADLYNSLS